MVFRFCKGICFIINISRREKRQQWLMGLILGSVSVERGDMVQGKHAHARKRTHLRRYICSVARPFFYERAPSGMYSSLYHRQGILCPACRQLLRIHHRFSLIVSSKYVRTVRDFVFLSPPCCSLCSAAYTYVTSVNFCLWDGGVCVARRAIGLSGGPA